VIARKYRVERQLGEGGMGTVMAAVDSLLDRPVAIKVLSIEHRKNEEAVARFLQEARAAVKLQSEHVVKVYDVGTRSTGSPFIVMEMLNGMDLSKVLDTEGALSVPEAISFVLEACEPVAEAHVQGIVHRDLKPANLFRSAQPDGTTSLKVLDFGISKLTSPTETQSQSFTRTSLLLGSPAYMSPEQLRNARDVDGRADIWALGTILFELIVGRTPFEAESLAELSAQILREPAPTPSSLAASPLPDGLDAVILKAIAKNRDERYRTITEFAMALAPFAPRRMWPTIEKIARLQNATAPSTQLPELAPTDHPEPNDLGRSVGEITASWGMTACGTPKRSRLRRLGVGVAGAALLGLGALLVVTTRGASTAPHGTPDGATHAAARPAPTSLAPAAKPTVSEPPEKELAQHSPAMPAETAADAGIAANLSADAAAPAASAALTASMRARTTSGHRKPVAKNEAKRSVFGGRK
jgi:serine/threonine-protein kinase